MLNDAESVQATLVPPEVVMKHTEMIKLLRQELLARDTVHKNLIDRYSTLKAVVEASHSKLDIAGGGKSSYALFVNACAWLYI